MTPDRDLAELNGDVKPLPRWWKVALICALGLTLWLAFVLLVPNP